MRIRVLASLCLTAAFLPLQDAAAAPPSRRAPGNVPPKPAATATPLRAVSRVPFNPPPCSVVANLKLDTAYVAAHQNAIQFAGPMTFTANRDLWDVFLYTMNYDDGHGWMFLGGCNCPQFPKGNETPDAAPPGTNFKRMESRTYQLTCAWPTGGLPQTGPFRFEVYLRYFVKDTGGAWQQKSGTCGTLTPTK